MLVPINWLREYTAVDADVETFCDRMIMSGSNIETVEHFGGEIKNVVVGKILSIEKHPDANKLVVCQIETGAEAPVQIVTGAANIAVGDFVPVALHGSRIPGPLHGHPKKEGGEVIEKGILRGVESNGMLCSAAELGYTDKVVPVIHREGIWILNSAPGTEYTPGMDIVTALGLEDDVIDFEITPNRPDCLSMVGMAREAAAVFDTSLSYPDVVCREEEGKAKDYIDVEIRNPQLCRRYVARVVKDVKVEQSPWWLQKRLMYAGMRPINNIVDVTNYVMLEYGHPIHAFDIRNIQGGTIIVDNAKEEEEFVTLDGSTRKLGADMLVIRDAMRPVAVAGVMGGLNSEIQEDTTTILIEAANFDGDSIRSTSKKLGLRTEASARFEKGIDPNLSEEAADRVCRLIEILGAGKVIKGSVDCYPKKIQANPVDVRVARVNQILGIDLTAKEMESIFRRLEMETLHIGGHIRVTPPTVRQDLEEEVDYAEEVGRIFGYDQLPVTLPKGNSQAGITCKQALRDLTRDALVGMGFREVQTYSFVSPKGVERIHAQNDPEKQNMVKLINPLGEDTSVMRTTLIPNMIEVLGRNTSRGNPVVRAFELGNTFFNEIDDASNLPKERESLCLAVYGKKDNFFTLKGAINELLAKLGMKNPRYVTETGIDTFHRGRCAQIYQDGVKLGVIGGIHPDIEEYYNIEEAYLCELSFDLLFEHSNIEKVYTPLPKYPCIERDIAVVVKEEQTVGELREVMIRESSDLLESIEMFDVYRGKPVPDGKKSVGFNLVYRGADHTLTDEEVSKVHERVVKTLQSELHVALRDA